MCCNGPRHPARGFSLAEVMVVLILLGISAAVVIPQFGSDIEQHALAAARTITFDLQYAQDLAVTSRSPVIADFASMPGQYRLADSGNQTLTHPITHKSYLVELGSRPQWAALTVSVQLVDQATQTPTTALTFDALGTPGAAGTITLSHEDLGRNVVLTVHAATGRVTVTRTTAQ